MIRNSLFEIEVRKNLRLCTITGLIPICSGGGNPTVIFIIIQATEIKIPCNRFIVKKAFFSQLAEMVEFWA